MKYSRLNEIPFDKYDCYGFDMDGTLYNEQLYIEQVYNKIAIYFKKNSKKNISISTVYDWMLKRWIEKGSSYPYIFEETIHMFEIKDATIQEAMYIYRNFAPILSLNNNIIHLFEQIPIETRFLITDGYAPLQKSKFQALELSRYFLLENCCFTGELGKEYYKPNSSSLQRIHCIEDSCKLIYFGDRSIDEQYCINAQMDFVHVQNFTAFWRK